MKKINLFLCLLSFSYLPLFAQFDLTGQVLNEKNKPIAFATVAVYAPNDSLFIQGSITTDKGQFILKNLAPNSYKIVVQMLGIKIGYKTYN